MGGEEILLVRKQTHHTCWSLGGISFNLIFELLTARCETVKLLTVKERGVSNKERLMLARRAASLMIYEDLKQQLIFCCFRQYNIMLNMFFSIKREIRAEGLDVHLDMALA